MKKGLSANILKIIAIVIMVVDHIAGYLYQEFKINDTNLSDEEYENMVRSEAVKEAKLIIDESGA